MIKTKRMSERWKYQIKMGGFWGIFMVIFMTLFQLKEKNPTEFFILGKTTEVNVHRRKSKMLYKFVHALLSLKRFIQGLQICQQLLCQMR